MTSEADEVRRRLRRAGLAPSAIRAVWPTWWSKEAEGSASAMVELRYTLARRLGLSPQSLFDDGTPEFLWTDEAKFKNVGAQSDHDLAVLTSFGVAIGQALLAAVPPPRASLPDSASSLREILLATEPTIGLGLLLNVCWSLGIPVVQLTVFPLGAKRMHALTVHIHGRFALLLGRRSHYEAEVAYIIAHELGHIARKHLNLSTALVEAEDPITRAGDDEEQEADRYALELLTGNSEMEVVADRPDFTARQLAESALRAAVTYQIDPGVLALCLGHSSGRWRQAFGALKIMSGRSNVPGQVNALARQQLETSTLPVDIQDFLDIVMGGELDR
jgi:hypothetical protein